MDETVARFGAVHFLVNHADITRPALIEKMIVERWQQLMDAHLTGAFRFLQAAGRHKLQRSRDGDKRGGSNVNLSSGAAAYVSGQHLSANGGYTMSMRLE